MYALSKIKYSLPGDLIRARKRQQKWESAALNRSTCFAFPCVCAEHTKNFQQITIHW